MVCLRAPRLLPLTICAMLLLLGAKVVTFGEEAGVALGLASGASPKAAAIGPERRTEAGPPATAVAQEPAGLPLSPRIGGSERELLQALRKRREELDEREHALDARAELMKAVELRLKAAIDHLSQLQDTTGSADQAQRRQADARWTGLVKIYEDMKPRDAAAIFDVLDMHVLLGVLDRMKDRKAAAILAAMQPDRARAATQMLALGRVAPDVRSSEFPRAARSQ